MSDPRATLRNKNSLSIEEWKKTVNNLQKIDKEPWAYLTNFEKCECPNCKDVSIFKNKFLSKHVHDQCGYYWYYSAPEYLYKYFIYDPFVNGFRSAAVFAFGDKEKGFISSIFSFIFMLLIHIVFAISFKIIFSPIIIPLYFILSNGKRVPMETVKITKDNMEKFIDD